MIRKLPLLIRQQKSRDSKRFLSLFEQSHLKGTQALRAKPYANSPIRYVSFKTLTLRNRRREIRDGTELDTVPYGVL